MKLKFILKGLLLWVTAFAVSLSILGIDSIISQGYLITLIIISICATLCFICFKYISESDFITLSGIKWIDKIGSNKDYF